MYESTPPELRAAPRQRPGSDEHALDPTGGTGLFRRNSISPGSISPEVDFAGYHFAAYHSAGYHFAGRCFAC